MQIKEIKIDDIIPYENNPRNNDDAVEYVANSIKEFGFKQPIVIDKDNVIIVGHTRWKASKKLGLEKVPCLYADDLTEDQIKAYRLADNKVGEIATWDQPLLDIEIPEIELDMELFGFDLSVEEIVEKKKSLSDEFIIPPFSILDARQGYWQDRKRAWKDLGIQSEVGRDENLISEGWTRLAQRQGIKNLEGTSIFDPVLCEIMYKWFNISGGKIYDCFAGGSVRGIVAEKLGYDYTGIDLSQRQIDANIEQCVKLNLDPNYICDNSLNADQYIEDDSVDLIFTCPPYFDLEVYSDNPEDLSNMNYDDFKKDYKKIIDVACRKLKDNRFAIFVVGDIRDKDGNYRNFIDYTKQCFNENGLATYNEFILVEPIGTAQLRARKVFATRKCVKTHQNVLVFFKGDNKTIKQNYEYIDINLDL